MPDLNGGKQNKFSFNLGIIPISFSVRLFALLGAENAHITKSWRKIVFGLAQNATFKMHSKRAIFMDRRRSINQDVHVRLNYYRWADGELRKYP